MVIMKIVNADQRKISLDQEKRRDTMVKLKDIAKETGLTVSTVSKALNQSSEISEATTALVKKTAQAMGYTARKSRRKEIKTIGVILPEVQSHYYAELMHSLNASIGEQGYHMIAMLTREFGEDIHPYVEKMCQLEPEGMIVSCDGSFSEETYECLLDSGIPALLLTNVDLPYLLDSIYIKIYSGVTLALEHLLSLGHRRIGYLGEYRSLARYQTFCKLFRERGLEPCPAFIKQGKERFEEGGYLRALELSQGKELPTAVLVSYDQMAYGAIRAFLEQGIRVPEDISVVSFDSNVMSAYSLVPLTTVTTPIEQMGKMAVKNLLDAIWHPKTHVVQNVGLQSRLIIRESTGSPREEKRGM